MKKLDKYLISQFFKILISSLIFIIGLYIVTIYVDKLKYFSHPGVPGILIVKYLINSVPEILIQVLPVAGLFSTIYIFGYMNSTNEIIALYNAKVGFLRLISPLLISGIMLISFSFLFTEFVSADSSRRALKTYNEIIKSTGKNIGYKYANFDFFLKGSDDTIYFIPVFDGEKGIMVNPVIFRFRGSDMIFQLKASTGNYDAEKKVWVFSSANIIRYNGSDKISEETFQTYIMGLKEKPENFMKTPQNVQQMRIKEAYEFIQKKKESGANFKSYLVDFYFWKFAYPFSIAISILIGSITGIYLRKAVLVLSLSAAIIIFFGYYAILSFGMAFGKSGNIDPLLASWIGNIAYILAGAGALRLKK